MVHALLFLVAATASAQTDEQYFDRLAKIERHVRNQRAAALEDLVSELPVGRLHTPAASRKFFEAGQSWSVDFRPSPDAMVRMSESPEDRAAARRRAVRYDFRVLGFDDAHRARIDVRQAGATGEHLVLVINDQFVSVRKELYRHDGAEPLVVGLGSGTQGNIALGFDAYPIDLPDLFAPGRKPAGKLPAALAGRAGVSRERLLEFRLSDLFGRPVYALWRDGDVWPLYMKTAAGTAVLVDKKEGASRD